MIENSRGDPANTTAASGPAKSPSKVTFSEDDRRDSDYIGQELLDQNNVVR